MQETSAEPYFHGGPRGFGKRLWRGEIFDSDVRMSLFSAHGEGGYPGNVFAAATFRVEEDSCLSIHQTAESDRDTFLNLTNHVYFNLDGHDSGSCRSHLLKVRAGRFIPVDRDQAPLGSVDPVEGTPFDFREWRAVGERIDSPCGQIQIMGGYDHYLILDADRTGNLALEPQDLQLYSAESGLRMSVRTSMPGFYLYTANSFPVSGFPGKNNCRYGRFAGLAIEPHYYPDGPNQKGFFFPVLHEGERYDHTTRYRFERTDAWPGRQSALL